MVCSVLVVPGNTFSLYSYCVGKAAETPSAIGELASSRAAGRNLTRQRNLGAKRFHSSTDLRHQLRWRDAIDVEQPVHTPVTDRIQIEGFGNTHPDVTLRRGPSQLHVGGGQVVTLLEPLPELSGWLVRRSDFGSCQNAVEIFLAAAGLRPEMLGKAVKRF